VARLVFDEQIGRPGLLVALKERGIEVARIADYGASGRPDPEVGRRGAEQIDADWVLVTMDLSILEDYSGFDWNRYALAWV
jgi:hypothetical protein